MFPGGASRGRGCLGLLVGMELPVSVRRLAYRSAYRVLQTFWFVRRPNKLGVKCLLTDDDRILLVRHTYGRRAWDLPGGAVKRGEPPREAAQREMHEELGLSTVQWVEFGTMTATMDHRHDTIHLFRAELTDGERLTMDPGELEAIEWFARSQLPSDLRPYVIPILRHAPSVDS
jgi:ADP-ribose pyrophosphatase YjhB (NUDIX family)